MKADDIEKISSLGSETPKRYVELITFRLTFENYRLVVCKFNPRLHSRFVLPVVALGWKIDVFGTPEEKDLPKVLIA